jgi:hypothetical protein
MDSNIVFQTMDWSQDKPSWSNSKIVYVLKCVPENYDVTDIVDAISVVLNKCSVRFTRLSLDEPITREQANKHSGGYYQAH